jgi:TRAP transporter TAXI family solute receptor
MTTRGARRSIRGHRASRWAALAALVLVAIGCSRGPDEAALRTEVQGKLDQRFKTGLFGLTKFRRQGSAPLPGSETGAKRLAVYYNATLKLNQGYDFGDWEALSPATLAQVLGATDKGIYGLKGGENRPGEVIQVYGSSTYEWAGDRWQNVEATSSGVTRPPEPGNAAPASQSKQLIDRLAAMVDIPPPGVSAADDAMISEELDRAVRAITVRRERRKHVFTVASGPEAGEYHPIADAFVARATKLDHAVKIRNEETAGSVENARLIGTKEADYALIQSNVAAMAAAGEGPFGGGAITSLRALGSLFPEPVHLVVPAASAIRTVSDLRGKRVAIGPADSGTRADAVAVLAAHGLTEKDLGEARDDGLESAAGRLRAGRLDAFFASVGAPTRELQRLAARAPIRLISLDAAAVERLVTQHSGLIRLVVPANTYPGQKEDATTVAATALLVTHADVPETEAALALRLIFENPDYVAVGSGQGAKISKRTGLRGITIPMHPAAARYFGTPAPAGASPTPAAKPKS